MGQLTRTSGRLLRTVGGKRHAGDGDHEEADSHATSGPRSKMAGPSKKLQRKEPPVAEDGALQQPRPKQSTTSKSRIPTPSPPMDTALKRPKSKEEKRIQESKAVATDDEPLSSSEDENDMDLRKPPTPPASMKHRIPTPSPPPDVALKQPVKKSAPKRKTGMRVPAKGMYAKGKGESANSSLDANKENTTSKSVPAAQPTENVWGFDEEFLSSHSPKRIRTQYGQQKTGSSTLANIHAKPRTKPAAKRTFSKKQRSPSPDGEESEVSMLSDHELDKVLATSPKKTKDRLSQPKRAHIDPELRFKAPKKTPRSVENDSAQSTTLADDELEAILNEPAGPTRLLHQLDSWVRDQEQQSSQPESALPGYKLGDIDEYIQQLPPDERENTLCSLCRAPVPERDYHSFWASHERTVRNQTMFCASHRRISAQEQYDREGYPSIDWDLLEHRISQHRKTMYEIMRNDRSSAHRDRFQPVALTGKAAAVIRKRRTDLPAAMRRDLEAYTLDDEASYPGYYGPAGRRAITEIVMRLLGDDIKNCTDSVVQASGPAAFVQAVLVPETAVRLIMEDCNVGYEEAEEIREKTVEIGGLLNEEVEDKVEVAEDSDEENDYSGR